MEALNCGLNVIETTAAKCVDFNLGLRKKKITQGLSLENPQDLPIRVSRAAMKYRPAKRIKIMAQPKFVNVKYDTQ